jgi:tRNA G37 N-methylase Trm5
MLDPFCGVGGNTIAFALSGRWKRVYAIEKDPATLECAMHNARVYGVHDQITWFEGDCFEILGLAGGQNEKAVPALRSVIEQYGVVFASPPWGGKSSMLSGGQALQLSPYLAS